MNLIGKQISINRILILIFQSDPD